MNKETVEIEVLLAQKSKIEAEIEAIRKNTPITESIKMIGSLVLGFAGLCTAILSIYNASYKLDEAKLAEKEAQHTLNLAKFETEKAKNDLATLKLNQAIAKSNKENFENQAANVKLVLNKYKNELSDVMNQLSKAKKQQEISDLQEQSRELIVKSLNAIDQNITTEPK